MSTFQKVLVVVLVVGVALAHLNTKSLNARLNVLEANTVKMNAQNSAVREDLNKMATSLNQVKDLLDEINTPLKMNKKTIEKNLEQVLGILEKIEEENPITLLED